MKSLFLQKQKQIWESPIDVRIDFWWIGKFGQIFTDEPVLQYQCSTNTLSMYVRSVQAIQLRHKQYLSQFVGEFPLT